MANHNVRTMDMSLTTTQVLCSRNNGNKIGRRWSRSDLSTFGQRQVSKGEELGEWLPRLWRVWGGIFFELAYARPLVGHGASFSTVPIFHLSDPHISLFCVVESGTSMSHRRKKDVASNLALRNRNRNDNSLNNKRELGWLVTICVAASGKFEVSPPKN